MSTSVGRPGYRYELVEGWGTLPDGWTLGQTSIFTDSEDRVFLFNRSDHPMIVLDRAGHVTDSWGAGLLTSAHGGTIDSDDYLYLPIYER